MNLKSYQRIFETDRTDITTNELKRMKDDEIIMLATKYPYSSQYIHHNAYNWIELWMAHRQGRRYMQTGGDIKSFKKKGIL